MEGTEKTNWDELAKLDVWLNRLCITTNPTPEQKVRNDVVLDLKNHIKSVILELSK